MVFDCCSQTRHYFRITSKLRLGFIPSFTFLEARAAATPVANTLRSSLSSDLILATQNKTKEVKKKKKKGISLMVQSSKDTILHSIRYTLFSRFIPLFRVTGKTFEIFVNKIRAFLISMYSVDSRHCMSNLVILWLHFQCTQNCNYKVNTEYLPLKNK